MQREKSMDDQGTTKVGNRLKEGMKVVLKAVVCLFCGDNGSVVKGFPRRGYGAQRQ
jgi:hypothetical protein